MTEERFDVELTQGAEDDLEAIHRYLAEHRSVEAADALLDRLLETIEALERFPHRGACPAELESLGILEFRHVLFDAYRLIYRIVGKKVVVLVVADGRRNTQALLERRLLGR